MKTKYDKNMNMNPKHFGKLLAVAICAIMVLLAAAPVYGAPGDPCDWSYWAWEYRGTRVCNNQCVRNTTIEWYENNGNCNWWLNCEALGYDNGECCTPTGPEICDNIDNDCDGSVDEGVGNYYYIDQDNDGYGRERYWEVSNGRIRSCDPTPPAGYVDSRDDCDDDNSAIHRNALEICDGIDNDCAGGVDDGLTYDTYYYDEDNDGYGTGFRDYCDAALAAADGYDATDGGDCDDDNPAIHPNALEICDGIDNDCENGVDDGLTYGTYYRDADGDTYGDPGNTDEFCSLTVAELNGFVSDDSDCDDDSSDDIPGQLNTYAENINLAATEICDGIDNDCLNGVDDGLTLYTYYPDADADGFGDDNPANELVTCVTPIPDGYVTDNTDCNDGNPLINPHPDTVEICDDTAGSNLIDEDCDGLTPPCNVGDDCDCRLENGSIECYGNIDCMDTCQESWVYDDLADDDDGICPPEINCEYWQNELGDVDCIGQGPCYYDLDGDTFGGKTVPGMSLPCDPGYVIIGGDCEDDPSTDILDQPPSTWAVNRNHLAAEVCDEVDNDCDDEVDEGLPLSTYYLDSDGDGYGNPSNSMTACGPLGNYVADNSDCNDNNALVHPGAYDLCQNGVDEDCDGADRICGETPNVCANLADFPLETQVESAPPIVMLLVDDSGSMAWDVLCPNDNGKFIDNEGRARSYYSDADPFWKSQYAGYNGVYYDPAQDYSPWPDSASRDYEDADLDDPRSHPNYTGTRDLSSEFDSLDGQSVKWAHYYVWSSIANGGRGAPYLVNITGSNGSYDLDYYEVTDCNNGECSSNRSYVDDYVFVADGDVPADVERRLTPEEERQNFANWYQYYRKRQLTAISALANVVNTVQGMKIGLHSVNHSVNMITPRLVDDYRGEILDDLYTVGASGSTPLRRGLRDVGNYFDNDTTGPYSNSSNGGDCQQAYTLMMTDGYWNGGDPGVGNTDTDGPGEWDGGEFADTYSNTLADVAMKYYEKDLNSNLADLVPISAQDLASHQHMVTYSVSFGLSGLYDPDDYPGCPTSNCPVWPNVTSSSEDERSITDLWHAAVNGRGKYMQANNAQQLAYALVALMQDVSKREGSGASVAVNSHELKQGSKMYQGTYNSAGWTGDVKAYTVNHVDGTVDADNPVWSAAAVLDARVTASGHTDRNIFTMGTGGGVAFTYANIGSLSNFQQESLGVDAVSREIMMNFIRGDYSYDENHNGSLRARITRLGDIIHSEPKFVNNHLYVGGNDGMLHVFSAVTGAEVFAYIPSFVYGNLDELANPDYNHRYFVDLTPSLGYDGNGDVLLIGGLGKGGKGYFCLDIDIANPGNFSASDVKWEYPAAGASAAEFANMGFTFSEPAIVNTESAGNILIFGNGYDSTNARAVLYALNPSTGAMLTMVDTGYGSPDVLADNCNGLSTPVFIDSNNNGRADTAYAGDLRGNVWKFDISGAVNTWAVVYQDGGGSPQPLFQARDAGGNPQPITTRLAVKSHCVRGYSGYIVIFGTGKFNASGDFTDNSTQAVYGIWDWASEWEEEGGTGTDKYMGIYNNPATGRLSNLNGHSDLSGVGDQLTLLNQGQSGGSVSYGGESWIVSSSNDINWFNVASFISNPGGYGSNADEGIHMGWTFTLPQGGERVLADPVVWLDYVLVVSQEPAENMCQVGGTAYLSAFNFCSGAAPDKPFFDVNGDGYVDEDDTLPNDEIPNRIILHDFVTYSPTMIGDGGIYFGPDEDYMIVDYPAGVLFWRFLNMN